MPARARATTSKGSDLEGTVVVAAREEREMKRIERRGSCIVVVVVGLWWVCSGWWMVDGCCCWMKCVAGWFEKRRWFELPDVSTYTYSMNCWTPVVQLEPASQKRLGEETCAIFVRNEPDLNATNNEYAGMVRFGA